jgi:hypothetical protein
MKITDIVTESTTEGSIATVAAPMATQSRNASIYGGKKGGNLLTGKKTKAKYANSVNESKKIEEAHLEEDDVIIVPGQGRSRKTGFIKHGESRLDHEVEMARSDLFQAAKNAKQIYEIIANVTEDEGLEGWVQEKIIKANDYLNTVREYLEHKQVQEMTGGVIAAGGVGESMDSAKTIRTFSGDRYVVPTGQEHEIDDYSKAVEIIKQNRRTPVAKEVYNKALATMKKYEENSDLENLDL